MYFGGLHWVLTSMNVVVTVSVRVINSLNFRTFQTVVGTTSISVVVVVVVEKTVWHFGGYRVFQPQDVFHTVSFPPRSTMAAADAAATRVRMLSKCIMKVTEDESVSSVSEKSPKC